MKKKFILFSPWLLKSPDNHHENKPASLSVFRVGRAESFP